MQGRVGHRGIQRRTPSIMQSRRLQRHRRKATAIEWDARPVTEPAPPVAGERDFGPNCSPNGSALDSASSAPSPVPHRNRIGLELSTPSPNALSNPRIRPTWKLASTWRSSRSRGHTIWRSSLPTPQPASGGPPNEFNGRTANCVTGSIPAAFRRYVLSATRRRHRMRSQDDSCH